MQLAYRHDERLGESYEALDGKKNQKKQWDLPPVSLGKSWVIVVGVWFGLWPRVWFASLFSPDGDTQIWGICVSSFVLVLLFCCVIRFAAFLMRPLCFMLNFKFVCLLIPMLGEPQSDIGHKREKIRSARWRFLKVNVNGRFKTDVWPIALPRLSCQESATCNFC